MEYPGWLLDIIRSPGAREPLSLEGESLAGADGSRYPIGGGIARLVFPPELAGRDKKWNRFYDVAAPLYDLMERAFGRIVNGVDIRRARREIVSLLGLQPGMRVLEVSPGPGVFQQYLRDAITESGQLVALDLSMGMLEQCRKSQRLLGTWLVQGNGMHLPFADGSFDALFHFGGVNLFNDPAAALLEFVRVVKSGGIVSWGDEAFDPALPEGWKKRLISRVNPGFREPRPAVPGGLCEVTESYVYGGYAYLEVGKKG